ncbi:MAG TPA: hypothetical protein VM689_24300 [Aliidongia sp.]|nr:hypothetical protein [Aliidongia sp.]
MEDKLKDLGKELLLALLLTDPAQRAQAAAKLYKQFSDLAKQVSGGDSPSATPTATLAAAAGSGAAAGAGSAAVAAATTTDGAASAAGAADGASAGDAANTAVAAGTAGATSATTAAAAPTTAAAPTSTAAATGATGTIAKTGQTSTANGKGAPLTQSGTLTAANILSESDPTGLSLSPTSVSNLQNPILKQITVFANFALSAYNSAVEEARRKGEQSRLGSTTKEVEDANKELNQAVDHAEGASSGTASGYTAGGSVTASPSPVLSVVT